MVKTVLTKFNEKSNAVYQVKEIDTKLEDVGAAERL